MLTHFADKETEACLKSHCGEIAKFGLKSRIGVLTAVFYFSSLIKKLKGKYDNRR